MMAGSYTRPDEVLLRRLDPDQPIDPSTGGASDVRYLDPKTEPLRLRCQVTHPQRHREELALGGNLAKTIYRLRWRTRDAAALDDRTPKGLRKGDLIVGITKPRGFGPDPGIEEVRLWVDDPRPIAQGILGVAEWTCNLLDRHPTEG